MKTKTQIYDEMIGLLTELKGLEVPEASVAQTTFGGVSNQTTSAPAPQQTVQTDPNRPTVPQFPAAQQAAPVNPAPFFEMAKRWIAGTQQMQVFKPEVFSQNVETPNTLGHSLAEYFTKNVKTEEVVDPSGQLRWDAVDTVFQNHHTQIFDMIANTHGNMLMV